MIKSFKIRTQLRSKILPSTTAPKSTYQKLPAAYLSPTPSTLIKAAIINIIYMFTVFDFLINIRQSLEKKKHAKLLIELRLFLYVFNEISKKEKSYYILVPAVAGIFKNNK